MFRKTESIYLVCMSIRNIDRIVTIFCPAKGMDGYFTINPFSAVILEATERRSIPHSLWDVVNVHLPHWQQVHVKKKRLFDDHRRHGKNRVFQENLPALSEQSVMLFSPALMYDHAVKNSLNNSTFTYSMLGGNLNEEQ